MANSRSAIKRIKIAERNRQYNVAVKSSIKTAIKKFENTLTSGDIAASEAALKNAISVIDKGVSKGVIHKNTGARKKSRLTVRLNAAR